MKTLLETVRAIEDAGFVVRIRTRKFSGEDMPEGYYNLDARREEDDALVECCIGSEEGVQDHVFAHTMAVLKKAPTASTTPPEEVAAMDDTMYFHRPIAVYDGSVLKCHGIATEENRGWMMAEPGTIELQGYRGDRITAATHDDVTGMTHRDILDKVGML
ncbi:hypothetical protein [Bradyrhizobium ottawaense]|uniref:hypothetical protein n=1 Tax=Bradyrhizobium ottawaense TaxID=931866 RepID=UPI0030F43AFF